MKKAFTVEEMVAAIQANEMERQRLENRDRHLFDHLNDCRRLYLNDIADRGLVRDEKQDRLDLDYVEIMLSCEMREELDDVVAFRAERKRVSLMRAAWEEACLKDHVAVAKVEELRHEADATLASATLNLRWLSIEADDG